MKIIWPAMRKIGKVGRYFMLAVSVLGITLVLIDLYAVLRPQDPLGEKIVTAKIEESNPKIGGAVAR